MIFRALCVRVPALVLSVAMLVGPVLVASGGSAAPPIPPVLSVTDLGPIVQNRAVAGRDGGFSALLGTRSVWTFGDTPLLKPNGTGQSWDDNSIAWTYNLDASRGITLDHDYTDSTGVPIEFLPYTSDELAYNAAHDSAHCTAAPCGAEYAMWPGAVVLDAPRGRALFFYGEIQRVAGQSGWTYIGSGIAVATPDGKFVRPIENPSSPTPTLIWDATEGGFDGGAVVAGNTLYSYGCVAGFLVMHCRVGRAPLAGALDKTQWTYYAGNDTWSPRVADAVTVFDGGAAANAVFYSAYLGVYMNIYSGIFSNDVYYRVSYTPWGPWSAPAFLFTGRTGWNGNTNYAARAHPEFAQGNGQIQYVTYAHTTGLLRMDMPLVRVMFGKP